LYAQSLTEKPKLTSRSVLCSIEVTFGGTIPVAGVL
jgi:hypothetical protein